MGMFGPPGGLAGAAGRFGPPSSGGGSTYQGPEPPGGAILGLREFGSMLFNIIPGLWTLANEGVAQPLISLIPFVGSAMGLQDPVTEFREAGQIGMDFANAVTGSLLSTALLPLSPLEAAIGTDELADFLEFIPEEYRPRTPAQTFDQGLLPGLFEHVGNVALAGGAGAKLGKAAGLAPTSRFMRGAQAARTPYRSTGRAAERIMRGQQFKVGGLIDEAGEMIGGKTVPAMPRVASASQPFIRRLDVHRFKQVQKQEVARAHADTRAEKAELEREGLNGITWLRKNLGHLVKSRKISFRQLEDIFQEDVYTKATIDEDVLRPGGPTEPPEGPLLRPEPLGPPPPPGVPGAPIRPITISPSAVPTAGYGPHNVIGFGEQAPDTLQSNLSRLADQHGRGMITDREYLERVADAKGLPTPPPDAQLPKDIKKARADQLDQIFTDHFRNQAEQVAKDPAIPEGVTPRTLADLGKTQAAKELEQIQNYLLKGIITDEDYYRFREEITGEKPPPPRRTDHPEKEKLQARADRWLAEGVISPKTHTTLTYSLLAPDKALRLIARREEKMNKRLEDVMENISKEAKQEVNLEMVSQSDDILRQMEEEAGSSQAAEDILFRAANSDNPEVGVIYDTLLALREAKFQIYQKFPDLRPKEELVPGISRFSTSGSAGMRPGGRPPPPGNADTIFGIGRLRTPSPRKRGPRGQRPRLPGRAGPDRFINQRSERGEPGPFLPGANKYLRFGRRSLAGEPFKPLQPRRHEFMGPEHLSNIEDRIRMAREEQTFLREDLHHYETLYEKPELGVHSFLAEQEFHKRTFHPNEDTAKIWDEIYNEVTARELPADALEAYRAVIKEQMDMVSNRLKDVDLVLEESILDRREAMGKETGGPLIGSELALDPTSPDFSDPRLPPGDQPPAPPSGGGQPPILPGGAAAGGALPPDGTPPVDLSSFTPSGHRATLNSIEDPELRAYIENKLDDPAYQKEVLHMRAVAQRLALRRAHRAVTESPVGALGIDPNKPGTHVTAKKRAVKYLGRAMQKASQAVRARTEGVLGERESLVAMSVEAHAAADIYYAKADNLENILPFQDIPQPDGSVKRVHRVNPIEPDGPAYRPVERAEGFEETDFEYIQLDPKEILTEKQTRRLGRYDVREETIKQQLSDAHKDRDALRAIPEEQLSENQLAKLEDLDEQIAELTEGLEKNAKNRENFIKKVEAGKGVTKGQEQSAEMRAAVRNAIEKERASAKLREARRGVEILRKRGAQERARATKLRADAEGPPEAFAQYRLGERLQRQADKMLEIATRGQEFVDPTMVPPEWYDMARAQKEIFNMLRDSGLNSAEVRNWMSENHLSWPAIVRRAAENGFQPVHWRQFTKDHTDRWARESFRLSPSKIQVAGTRRARKGLVRPEEVDRGFRSIVAAAGEISWEIHSNNIVDYLLKHGFVTAKDEIALKSGTHIPYRMSSKELGHPEFAAFLAGNDVDPSTTQFMISKPAAEALRSMNRSYDHAVWRGMAKFTDPWRTMTLTYSPRWYVYNTIGNFIMTSAEIGPWNTVVEWRKQWKQLKKETGGIHNIFTPEFARRTIDPAFQRMGLPQEVPGPSELEQGFFTRTLPEARLEGQQSRVYRAGAAGLYNQPFVRTINERMQRVNEVVDELSRESVKAYYMSKKGGKLSAEKATQRAVEALVNYSDMSPFERTVVRSFVPFYAWQKGMLKMASRLAIDHPARVHLTIMIGRLNSELWDEEKETLPEYYQGLIDVPGFGYLQTRGMNPFTDAPALVTPTGIAQSLNPFIEIARKWMFRDEGIPFGPKEEGPFGYAQGRPSIGQELFRLGAQSFGGGILRDLASTRPDQPLVPGMSDVGGAFGLRTFSPQEVALFKQRQAAQQAQIAGGLPLPPAQRQTTWKPGQGFGPPGFSNRSAQLLGAPLLPVSTSALYRTR